MHERKWAHLDIKPSNFVFIKTGRTTKATLIDFESATRIHPKFVKSKHLGTEDYRKRDYYGQCRTADLIGKRCDTFAYGIMLIDCFREGGPSKRKRNVSSEIRLEHLHKDIELCPPEYRQLLTRMTMKDGNVSMRDCLRTLTKLVNYPESPVNSES